ncbi:ARHGB factor, partial [Aegithalos caudatus]|nr:ARHGB factor [Aegithalos caudatus]
MSGRDSQEGSQEERGGPEPNGIQINRKAQEEGPEEATPTRGCSQSEPKLQEGGGASAEGNFFYLSLPTGPPQPGGGTGDTLRDISGDIPGSVPGDTLRDISGDTELILGTLEELRGKLLRLRDLEAAHWQLLRSLGGGDATALGVPNNVPNIPDDAPNVPSVPVRAVPPPGPQSSSRALRGQGG